MYILLHGFHRTLFYTVPKYLYLHRVRVRHHHPPPITHHTPHRQQLSSRVIRGRSISILLEKRLAATFAHCFPRKSPLAMLEDLDSSQTLMDRFCDSELLESLDQLMLQASQHTAVSVQIHDCTCTVLYRDYAHVQNYAHPHF